MKKKILISILIIITLFSAHISYLRIQYLKNPHDFIASSTSFNLYLLSPFSGINQHPDTKKILDDTIKSCNSDFLKRLIILGTDVNQEKPGSSPHYNNIEEIPLGIKFPPQPLPIITALNNKCPKEMILDLIQAGARLTPIKEELGRSFGSLTPPGRHTRRIPFHVAATISGDYNILKAMIDAGADINENSFEGKHIINLVSNIKTINHLISLGADIKNDRPYSAKPICQAAADKKNLLVYMLLQQGIDINTRCDGGSISIILRGGKPLIASFYISHSNAGHARFRTNSSPLLFALNNKNDELAEFLIRHGANVNQQDSFGITPVITAALRKNAKMIERLVHAGADINTASLDGITPFLAASYKGSLQDMEKLISLGAGIKATDIDGNTAMHFAAHDIQKIKYLKSLGLDINQANHNGETPLLKAIRYAKLPHIKEMIKLGANLKSRDNNNASALIYAGKNRNHDVLDFLLSQGFDIKEKDKNGWNILFSALDEDSHHISQIKYLVEKGADPLAVTNTGKTTIMATAEFYDDRSASIIRYLQKHNVQLYAKDKQGKNILDYVSQKQSYYETPHSKQIWFLRDFSVSPPPISDNKH